MSQLASPGATARLLTSQTELRREFTRVDRNADGRIDFAEFKVLLAGLDAGMTPQVMQIGFNEVDTNKDGCIDLQEFCDWWSAD